VKQLLIVAILILNGIELSSQSAEEFTSSRYTVYYFLGEDCKICQYYTPTINRLDSLYSSDSLQFLGLFPSRYSNEEGIQKYRDKYAVSIPMKREYFGSKAKKFGVTITPEVVLYDEQNEAVLYQGRIDDSYVRVGKRKRVIQSRELEEAILNLMNGEEIVIKKTAPIGCYITFN